MLESNSTPYVLTMDVSSTGTCFTITANGVTLDGAGHSITYATSSLGYAINNSGSVMLGGGRNGTTIKNLKLMQSGGPAVENSHAISISGASNTTMTNIQISTLGSSSYGIYLGSASNATLRNITVTTSGTLGHGIYLQSASNVTLLNNSITTSNAAVYGIYLQNSSSSNTLANNSVIATGPGAIRGIYLQNSSNSNILTGNNVTIYGATDSYGIYIESSGSNNVTGGSIIATASYDYGLQDAGTTNNFADTNFTAASARNIYFYDSNSWFNYRNRTSDTIILKTAVSTQGSISRTLSSWSNSLVAWNDTNSTEGAVAAYNITGLPANSPYKVYNTSIGTQTNPYTPTSDSAGGINFTIKLNENTGMRVEATSPIGISSCQTLTTANTIYVLTQNVSSAATCFSISANNITIDGAGYTINYSTTSSGFAVNTAGSNFTTMKNLNVVHGNAGISSAHAFYLYGSNFATISNNSIATSGSSTYGIALYLNSSSNNLTNNTIVTAAFSNIGVFLNSSSSNTISNNTITSSGGGYAINLNAASTSNTISDNMVVGSGSTQGIYLNVNCNSNALLRNKVQTSGGATHGIYLLSSSSSNTISNNNVTTSGGSTSYGIYLQSNSNSNTISNNTVTTYGTSSYGIYFYSSSLGIISNNTINTTGASGHGIYLDTSSNSSTFSNNTVVTSGNTSFGVYFDTSSKSNTFSNNTITTSGRSGYGFYIFSNSNSNALLNNTITTSGASSHGVYIQTSTNATMKGNKIGTTNAYAVYIVPTSTVSSATVSYYNHTIDATNTEGGKTIYYYFANSSIIIEDLYDIGQLFVTNSTNITIRNITVIGGDAITLAMTRNSSIAASNITISGGGVHGIYVHSSSTSNTVSNNTVTTWGSDSYGIYLNSSSTSNTILNNTITTSGSDSHGAYLRSSSNLNTLSNNTIVTFAGDSYGIYLQSSDSNNITGGSIISRQSYDYYLEAAGTANNFTDTNFTAATRAIYLYDSSSWFNYRNRTSDTIILKTASSQQGSINRTLLSWNSTLVRWTDTNSTAGTLASYNITGLPATSRYRVYNTSMGLETNPYFPVTDASGRLNFTIRLNGNTDVRVEAISFYAVAFCQNLTIANAEYVLVQNVSATGTCFTISAGNITLDGAGYTVTYSTGNVGYGINNSLGYDNITVSNMRMTQGGSDNYAFAIYGIGMSNSTLTNNTITTSRPYSYGISLKTSDSNTVSNNTITTSGEAEGYGIFLDTSDLNTVSNNTITTSGDSNSAGIHCHVDSHFNIFSNNIITTSGSTFSFGIFLQDFSDSNTISNNTITTSGSNSDGIYFSSSSSNTLLNNTITTLGMTGYGISFVNTSVSNSVTGGSIISRQSHDYALSGAGSTSNFTNTNFTGSRRIYFADASSYFNYNNQTVGDIWLKTGVSAASYLTRTLSSWNSTLMKWNDTNSTTGVTASYTLTGLAPNTQYRIYNVSRGVQTGPYFRVADASGGFNFTIRLNGNTEIRVEALSFYALTSCQALTTANVAYGLVQSISATGTCFTISANNITLDGAGHTITYAASSLGYAISNALGYDNITVHNLRMTQGGADDDAHAIYCSGMGNSTLNNNTITTAGFTSEGIYLTSSSSSNTVSNNTITVSGLSSNCIYLASSSNSNIISNNTFIASGIAGNGIYFDSSGSNTISNNTITASASSVFGIVLVSSSGSNTISNNTITASSSSCYGIWIESSDSNTVSSNAISSSGTGGAGIGISSSTSNTLLNNTIITSGSSSYGIQFQSSTSNNVTGGSIISRQSYDYSLIGAGATNNFTETNFTALRRMYFYDTTSYFNYNNRTSGNLTLSTRVSAQGSLSRTISNWNSTLVKWNDTNSIAGMVAFYNVTGLSPNSQYTVYNTSGGTQANPYFPMTDASGWLNFSIRLNGNTEIRVEPTSLYDLTTCKALTIENGVYTLVQNVSATGTCFTISADNITLDGGGHTINYSTSSAGYAISNALGYDNINISNLRMTQGGSDGSAYAIYGAGMVNSTFTNNTITTSGSASHGIYLNSSSNSNAILNNTITVLGASGIFIFISNSNTVSDSDITSSGGYGTSFSASGSNTLSNNVITTSAPSGYGVNLESSSTSNSISNNTITASGPDGHGIYIQSSSNSNGISNNIITSTGGHGIVLYSSGSSTLSNNTVVASGTGLYGVYLRSSGSNNITGGSIVARDGYDYYLHNASTTNNFTEMNFTAQRRIYFNDTTSYFNYNNRTSGSVRLGTRVSAPGFLNRTLSDWSSSFVRWNDTNSTAGLNATYNVTGLLASTTYRVYNSSRAGQANPYNLTTNSSGALDGFLIKLNGNTELTLSAVLRYNFTLQNFTSETISNATLRVYTDTSDIVSVLDINSSAPPIELDLEGCIKYHFRYGLQSGHVLDIKNLTISASTAINPQFVGSFSGTLPSLTTARSYTIALNDSALSYGYAEITMPVNGTVNRVLHCTSWNFTVSSCSNWESNSTSSYPGAVVNATHLIFNATRFDAYAGGYLEATPTPTPTPTSTSAAAGGAAGGAGGGGGGGGGAGGPALPTKKVTASSDEQVPIKIAVSLKNGVLSPSVKITAGASPSSSGIPAPQGDAVYHYLDITKTNFNNSDIETATIEFEVNLSWISENGINNVYLARYENGSGNWKKLRTELVNSTQQFSNSYKAYTDGFSDFAIVGEKAKPSGSIVNPDATVTPTAVATTGTTPSVGSGTPSPTVGATTGMTNGNKNSLPWTQIGILLVVVVVVVVAWSLRASLLGARHIHTTRAVNVTSTAEKTQAAEETQAAAPTKDETPEAPAEREK